MTTGEPYVLDVDFDFSTDAGGKDPDTHSPTLRRYHQLLWSKPLASGETFTLELPQNKSMGYLIHQSTNGRYVLGSDMNRTGFRSA